MEDLDSLLEDLGRGKSNTKGAASNSRPNSGRPISSRVDLNELEDLMTDLAAPTAKKTPEPTPVMQPQATQVSEVRPVSTNMSSDSRPVSTISTPPPNPTPVQPPPSS